MSTLPMTVPAGLALSFGALRAGARAAIEQSPPTRFDSLDRRLALTTDSVHSGHANGIDDDFSIVIRLMQELAGITYRTRP